MDALFSAAYEGIFRHEICDRPTDNYLTTSFLQLFRRTTAWFNNKPSSRCSITCRFSLISCLAIGLSSCGGGNSNVIIGKVADGYINGATVCLDMNKNTVCDPGEPSAQSIAGGVFSLTLTNPNDINLYPLAAEVPATAIDEDTGLPVGQGYSLSSPPLTTAPFISPISTLVQEKISQGIAPAQAKKDIATALGLPDTVDITADFIASPQLSVSDKQIMHKTAQVVARIFAANHGSAQNLVQSAGINNAGGVNSALNNHVINNLQSFSSFAGTRPDRAPITFDQISGVDVYLNPNTLAADLKLNPAQTIQLNNTITAQGSTSQAAVVNSIPANPDGSCAVGATPPNALGGLAYQVQIPAHESVVYCFEVTESKQNVIVKINNTTKKMKFDLMKKSPAGAFDQLMTPISNYGYMRFSNPEVPGLADRSLTKGVYQITFREKKLIFSAYSSADVVIYSNANDRIVKNINFLTQNKIVVKPYQLSAGSKIIKGSLNLAQDGEVNGWKTKKIPTQPPVIIQDIIPLQLSGITLANASFNVVAQGGKVFDVAVMNAAYANSVITSDFVGSADWEIWQGTSTQLANQTFNFSKSADSADSYYLILTRLPAGNSVTDDVPYTVTVTTTALAAVSFNTGQKTYQVSAYDQPQTAVTGMLGRAAIATAAGTPVNRATEFLTTTKNIKNLTSAMQTFKSVMEFDESATMRFYADYADIINGVNNANTAVSLLDAAATLAADVLTGDYAGAATKFAVTAVKQSAGMSIDQLSKYHATNFMSYSFNVLREYSQKKKVFINGVYGLGSRSVSADLIGTKPVLQSKLMELFVLQSRATRVMKFGMDIYKSTAKINDQTYFQFMADRAVNFAISFVPNTGALGSTANALATINGDAQLLVNSFTTGLNLYKSLQTTWTDLLNVLWFSKSVIIEKRTHAALGSAC